MPQQSDNWLGLHGKVCVVTGAGGGIGRAVALGMAQAGASVVLLDNNGDNCRATADALGRTGAKTLALECDIANPDSVAAAEHAAQAVGPCDVLVNNAGMLLAGPLATVSLEDWNRLLAVNLTGYLLCAQAFGKAMIERGRGAIVHTASIAGSNAQGFSGAYSVSKADAVAAACGGMGAAWGAEQRHEPGAGAHAHERNVLSGPAGAAAASGGDPAGTYRVAGRHGSGGAVPGQRSCRIREWTGNHRRWRV